jgi:signal transduction histidine kinase
MSNRDSIYINQWLTSKRSQFNTLAGCPIDMQYDLDNSISCWIAQDWLSIVCNILILNSREAMNGEANKRLTISTQQHQDWAELVFTDTGKGIAPELQDLLGSRPIRHSNGSGMGLYMADLIIKIYDGTIHIRKPGPRDTTIVISLPIS